VALVDVPSFFKTRDNAARRYHDSTPDELFKSLHRRSTRLAGFDYGSNCAYVLTICSRNRGPHFGQIIDGHFEVSAIGAIVERKWHRTLTIRPAVLLDSFVLMPNHLHGIIVLNADDDLGRNNKTEHEVSTLLRTRLGRSEEGSRLP
jgi:putative transposase